MTSPGSTTRRVMMALASVAVLGVVCVSPALAERDNHRDRHDNRRGANNQREWRGNHWVYGGRPLYRHPYAYAQPVYVPPPVYYEPRQSPGISLFFPLDMRRQR